MQGARGATSGKGESCLENVRAKFAGPVFPPVPRCSHVARCLPVSHGHKRHVAIPV